MSQNSAIEIFLRSRPTKRPSTFFSINVTFYIFYKELQKDENKCEFKIPKDATAGYVNNTLERHAFEFNEVFGSETTQQEIFDKIAKPVVDSAIEGYNGTIFAYG